MGPKMPQACRIGCSLQFFPYPGVGVRQSAHLDRRSENPVFRCRELSCLLPAFEHFHQITGNYERLAGILRLNIVDNLLHDATFHSESPIQPINIRPLQSEGFTDAKTEARAHQSQGLEWLAEMQYKQAELPNRQNTRLPDPLGCAFHLDQAHWVCLHWNVSLPHRRIWSKRARNTSYNRTG